MKAGTENRNKTIAAAALGMCALIGVVYMLFTVFGGGSSTPPPAPAAVGQTANSTNSALTEPAPTTSRSDNEGKKPAVMPTGNAAGVAATKIATSSASLDPTLDQTAMLRTERLLYSGSGRNIFSSTYTPPVVIPTVLVNPRKTGPAPPPPPVIPQGPPPPPPINLKFFGTVTSADGARRAFLLQGDDVFLAGQGDIVARRYKIVSVASNSIQVEDMSNANTQTLPLQSN
jgi:hypothetical protein